MENERPPDPYDQPVSQGAEPSPDEQQAPPPQPPPHRWGRRGWDEDPGRM
jgi:hypothetical protein